MMRCARFDLFPRWVNDGLASEVLCCEMRGTNVKEDPDDLEGIDNIGLRSAGDVVGDACDVF